MTETFQIKEISKLGNRVEASIRHGERMHLVFFESEDFDLAPVREALVAFCLYPCMKTGCDLDVNGNLSRRMLAAIPHIQDFYHCWDPSFQHVALRNAQPQAPAGDSPRRVALFFSGGLDCWYSLLKSQAEITDLVYLWGFDIPLSNPALYEKALASIRQAAEAFNTHLIVIRTNARDFTEKYVPYNKMYGSMLAGLAHLLSKEVGKVYIAGGEWYTTLVASGSHVLTDERWSTENLQIIYDGLELSRLGKARVVGQNELAMQTLRVCWANPDNDYNCGRCEKCLRTMVNLQVAGALERCTVFAVPLSLKRLSKLTFFDSGDLIYLEENTRAAQKQPHNRKLFRTLRRVINRFYFFDFLRRMRGNYPHLLPNLSWVKKRLRRVRMK
jgi:hypothetical protein